MRLEDWREWPAERLAPEFERQARRWREELGWDARPLFDLVESARAAGQLPGLVAVDVRGGIAGWCYANLQDGLLFIGALHGQRADVVRVMLDEILAGPEAAFARGYRCFVFPDTPAVAAALSRRRFDLEPFLYLSRPLPGRAGSGLPWASRGWSLEDLPETARLFARAYAGTTESRCFAPGARLDEWAAYVVQLGRTPACGEWHPAASLACPAEDPADGLRAALIATRLSAETSHVAQIAVDPAWRRRGVASALVDASAALAGAAGARSQTLLVAGSNEHARRMYSRLGFTQSAAFLFADRARISRGTTGTIPARDPAQATA